jgi:hypothetical protein
MLDMMDTDARWICPEKTFVLNKRIAPSCLVDGAGQFARFLPGDQILEPLNPTHDLLLILRHSFTQLLITRYPLLTESAG